MKRLVLTLTIAAMAASQGAFAQNRVKNLYAESQTLNVEQVLNSSQTVRINRYLFAGYNTLCLPLSLSADQLNAAAKGLKVERMAAIGQEGNTLCLYFVDCTAEGIQAGVPYLVFSPEKQYLRAKNTDAVAADNEIVTLRMSDGQGNQVAFGSSWQQRNQAGLYGIPAKQDVAVLESILVRTSTEQSFLPTRCGFSWEEQAPTAQNLEIRHISAADLTAISAVKQVSTDGAYYTIDGVRVNSASKAGLYIKNGKKVIKR